MLEGDRGEGVVREDHHRPLVDQGQQRLHSLDVFHTILCLLEPIHVWVREVEWVRGGVGEGVEWVRGWTFKEQYHII